MLHTPTFPISPSVKSNRTYPDHYPSRPSSFLRLHLDTTFDLSVNAQPAGTHQALAGSALWEDSHLFVVSDSIALCARCPLLAAGSLRIQQELFHFLHRQNTRSPQQLVFTAVGWSNKERSQTSSNMWHLSSIPATFDLFFGRLPLSW